MLEAPTCRVEADMRAATFDVRFREFKTLVEQCRMALMLEIEHISVIPDEVRTVVEEEWPELAHKLPPKSQH
jgi:hypothetical protein